jgi:hypothetical protein
MIINPVIPYAVPNPGASATPGPPLTITVNATINEIPTLDLIQIELRDDTAFKTQCGRNTATGSAELIIPSPSAADKFQIIVFGLAGAASVLVSGDALAVRSDGATYNIDLAGLGAEAPTAGTISGSLQIDGSPEARPILAISAKPMGTSQQHRLLGKGDSSAIDGSYVVGVSVVTDCILVALDNYGDEWQANADVAVDDIIHPTVSNGYYYVCVSSGNTGANEPAWWADSGNHTQGSAGTAVFAAYPYYRPLAHGPLTPTPV